MNIIVYTTPTCPYCRLVKDFLSQRGVPFVEKDVSVDQAAAMDMVRRTSQQGVPVTEIDGQFVIGFDRPRLEHLLQQPASRPTLGVSVADAARHAPAVGQGAYVGKVHPGSPAGRAGLQKGDVITQLGGHATPDAATLVNLSRRVAPGQQVPVRFVRNGQIQTTSIVTFPEAPI
jgi:glutaredoxin-like YruB-family protein